MESLLHLRQLRLWEAVCQSFPISARYHQQVKEWIQAGTLREELEKLQQKGRTTRKVQKT